MKRVKTLFCSLMYFNLLGHLGGVDAYTDWSDWSSCSESCGTYGAKTSVRSCLNDKLCYIEGTMVKELVKTMPCYGGECQSEYFNVVYCSYIYDCPTSTSEKYKSR